MSESAAYKEGAEAVRQPDADKRCPYETETPEALDWWRGFEDTMKAE